MKAMKREDGNWVDYRKRLGLSADDEVDLHLGRRDFGVPYSNVMADVERRVEESCYGQTEHHGKAYGCADTSVRYVRICLAVFRGEQADPPSTCRDDDAKSTFASCGHAAGLALGSNVPILLQKSPSRCCGIVIWNNRIGVSTLLNQRCVLALNIESMFRVEMLKILLQQYLPNSGHRSNYSITDNSTTMRSCGAMPE
jgi:hypothetical protein